MDKFNLKIYFSLIALNNLWFITSNWLFFWMKYMSMGEVGVVDSIAFMVGILFEFPAGIISDKISRKSAIIISQLFSFIGTFIIFLSNSKFEIAIGFIIFQIGVAFYNSSIEPFGYETSVYQNSDYSKVVLKSASLANFFYILSLLVGGYLYTINENFPNFLFSLNFLIGLVCSLLIKSYVKINTIEEKPALINFLNKFDVRVLLYFWFFLAINFSFDYGFLKLSILETISDSKYNYLYIIFATAGSIYLSSKLLSVVKDIKKTLRVLFYFLVIILISSKLLIFPDILIFLYLSFITIFINQLFLNYVNEKLEDSVRGSVFSFMAFLYKFPYVLISLIFGFALESMDITQMYLIIGVLFVITRLLFKFGIKLGYNWIFEKGA